MTIEGLIQDIGNLQRCSFIEDLDVGKLEIFPGRGRKVVQPTSSWRDCHSRFCVMQPRLEEETGAYRYFSRRYWDNCWGSLTLCVLFCRVRYDDANCTSAPCDCVAFHPKIRLKLSSDVTGERETLIDLFTINKTLNFTSLSHILSQWQEHASYKLLTIHLQSRYLYDYRIWRLRGLQSALTLAIFESVKQSI